MIVREHFELGETAVTIVADERYVPEAKRSIFESRQVLDSSSRGTRSSGPPWNRIQEGEGAPSHRKDVRGGPGGEVGPMAAVAGAVAEAAVEAMLAAGALT